MTTTNQRAVEVCKICSGKGSVGHGGIFGFRTCAVCNGNGTTLRTPGWRPISEEQVEAAAIRMWNAMGPGPEWTHQTERKRNQYRTMARAALSTLPPPPGEG